MLLSTPTGARILLWCCFLFFMSAIVWAAWAELDEVTVGQGKVIPSRQLQVIQNLEGGIVKEIFVKEGDIVEKRGSRCCVSMTPVSAPILGNVSRRWSP
ncbi:hypothetical protein ACF2JD_22340 [Aeromonas sp. A-5]|uniref:hypothetical protein n=1 Tax=Aeromonas ichthyocola TaxID=3367746 RepID=UPI0038DD6C18